MRLAADERAAGARGLLMDVVVHLLASELDDVRKKEDVTKWSDAQLVLWMKDHLSRYLWQLRALTGSAAQRRPEQAAQKITRLKAENAQLSKQHLLNQLEANSVATYKATMTDQRQQIECLQRELADSRADLEIARSQAARSAAPTAPPPVIIDMPITHNPHVQSQPATPPPMTTTSDRYAAWQQATAPEILARQQKLIEVVGEGEAFFRAKIVEALHTVGLLQDDPGAWAAKRLLASVNELGLIEEMDGGFGASVQKVLTLTAIGCVAYERLTGAPCRAHRGRGCLIGTRPPSIPS